MSFEAIISLILFLLFVIVPALSGNRKKPDPKAGRQQPPAGQDRPGQAQRTGPQAERPAGEADSWEARLRDARRRIEEAMGETSMEVPRQSPAPASGQPAATPAVRPARPLTTAGPTPIAGHPQRTEQQRAVRMAQQNARDSQRAAAERTRRLRESGSTELQVTRLDSPRPYTGRRRREGATGLFSQESLQNGLIWHQVLSEPPHKRGRRRTSRLRSP